MPRPDAEGRLEVKAAVRTIADWSPVQLNLTFQLVDGEGQGLAVGRRLQGVQVDVQPGDVLVLRRQGQEGGGEVLGDEGLAAT